MRIIDAICLAAILGLSALPGCSRTDAAGAGALETGEGDPRVYVAGDRVEAIGIVEHGMDDSPLEGVKVSLEGEVVATTGEDGRFVTDLSVATEFTLRFDKQGFAPLFVPTHLPSSGLAEPMRSVFLFPTAQLAQLPGESNAPGPGSAMLLVEVDSPAPGGGEKVELSAGHGKTFVLGAEGGAQAGDTVPSKGVDESVFVLFLDVEADTTGVEIHSPKGECALVDLEQRGGAVPLTRGGMTYLYANCGAPRVESAAGVPMPPSPPDPGTPRAKAGGHTDPETVPGADAPPPGDDPIPPDVEASGIP